MEAIDKLALVAESNGCIVSNSIDAIESNSTKKENQALPLTLYRDDFITVVTTSKPCNKKVYRENDGTLKKKPANTVYLAEAQTHYVPDPQALAKILKEVSVSIKKTIILGYIPGTEPATGEVVGSPYKIRSRKILSKLLGIEEIDCPSGLQEINGNLHATRTKDNFSASSWVLLDYDKVTGMPEEFETDSHHEWWGWMEVIIPGLDGCAAIITPSTTSRVLSNGKPAFDKGGWHAYIQVKNATDLARFGSQILIYAMSTQYGFIRPIFNRTTGEITGHRSWTIFDSSTFSPERLVFDGSPIVNGKGLSVVEANIEVYEGGRLDTTLLKIGEDVTEKIERKSGCKVDSSKSPLGPQFSLINDTDLKLYSEIETEKGLMTIENFWSSDEDKLRAQAYFRPESQSQAAYLGRHQDGTPFHYDTGAQTKYVLSKDQINDHYLSTALRWVKGSDERDVNKGWIEYAKPLDIVARNSLMKVVHEKTQKGFSNLKSELNQAKKDWKAEQKKESIKASILEEIEKGKIVLDWDEANLPDIVDQLGKQLKAHISKGYVFCSSGQLVTVSKSSPVSMRQINQKNKEGETYTDQYTIMPFTITTTQLRVLESVAFLANDKYIGCPKILALALLDDPSFANPFSGLLEVPTVMPDGRFLNQPGYDTRSALYCTFNDRLTKNQNITPTKKDAIEAYDYIVNDVFDGFPFRGDTDKAAAVAFLLTSFIRKFLTKAPGFLITATTQSSGKSTLADLVFQAVSGRPAAAASWTDNQEEMQKHILAILMGGQSGICFDNLPYGSYVDGDELAKLLTQETYQARKLGKNITVYAPTNILVALTGNQLTPINDMVTRLLPIHLAPNTECPENSLYNRKNIDVWHAKNRPKIVVAVNTIMLAWHLHGGNVALKPSRFSEWDEAVRKPLLWLNAPDLMTQFDENKAEDPYREMYSALLHEWHSTYGDSWKEVGEILDQWPDDTYSRRAAPLGAILQELFPKGKPTTRQVAAKLNKLKDGIFGEYKLIHQPADTKSKSARPWRVIK